MKHRSDAITRRRACRAAQPTRPLPNLCPTSQTLSREGLPNLPNLLAHRAYMKNSPAICLYVRNTGWVGWVGWAEPDTARVLTAQPRHARSGRLGRRHRAVIHPAGEAIASATVANETNWVLPRKGACGTHGRKNALVGGFELWFKGGARGSVARFNEGVA